jgi:hypothetical protein
MNLLPHLVLRLLPPLLFSMSIFACQLLLVCLNKPNSICNNTYSATFVYLLRSSLFNIF